MIGIADQIFTRVGAGDNPPGPVNLHGGDDGDRPYPAQRHSQSLVVLDEIGWAPPPSTACLSPWAVAEYLYDTNRKARTLFATHYHELADLAATAKGSPT